MRKVKYKGDVYEVRKDDLRYYDGYLVRGEIQDKPPLRSDTLGYFVMGKQNIAVCHQYSKHTNAVIMSLIGICAIAVVGFGVFVFTRSYGVTPWVMKHASGDDVIGELDDGTRVVNKKFSYSYYTTYDGYNVNLLVNTSYKDGDIAVSAGDKVSEYQTIANAMQIPIDLNLSDEEIMEGKLLLRRNESVTEYPLVIERLVTVAPVTLKPGTIYDREVAADNSGFVEETESVVTGQGNLMLESAKTDENVRVDFENFEVIQYKRRETETE